MTLFFLWLKRKSNFMDANLGCKLQTENIDAMGAIRQLWGDPGEQQWQWVVLFKCEWPEIMSSNCSLFLFFFNLKGHRVFLKVQRPHLPKPAKQEVKKLIAKQNCAESLIIALRASWMDPSHLHQNTSEVEIWIELFFNNHSQALFDFRLLEWTDWI